MDKYAIVGYSFRFPKAKNEQEFWENLVTGRDCIAHGKNDPDKQFVGSYGQMDDIYDFDADFFGISKRDAVNMDPQQRYLITLCQEALEHANHKISNDKQVGIFAGIGDFFYVWKDLFKNHEDIEAAKLLSTAYMDGTATLRASYTLGVTGPSLPVKNACASSLMAIHLAMESLNKGECSVALAGGVSIQEKQDGYIAAEGTLSKTGTVRPFDEYGDGFVPGNGGGIIAIKPLKDAIESGDVIYAVISGSGISNDGKEKSGYSAPSVSGECRAIRQAFVDSDFSYKDISYVELHGTATQLGDVIEAEALKMTYGKEYKLGSDVLYVGSVKSNVGHLNYAAGVAGVIKIILMIKNRTLVPTAYFQQENKKLGIGKCNILVNRFTRPWNREHLVAAVSSFGIGGVNCHLVLEEYSKDGTNKKLETKDKKKEKIVAISGPSKEHVKDYCKKLDRYICEKSDIQIEDIAKTLWYGRDAQEYRCVVLAENVKELSGQLLGAPLINKSKPSRDINTLFMFGGSNYYERDNIIQLIESNVKLKEYFYSAFECVLDLCGIDIQKELRRGTLSSFGGYMLHFCVQYSIGEFISEIGIEPGSVMGYSAGEYMAAYFAGVLSLEDTFRICAKRYLLFEKLEEGTMVSIMAKEDVVKEYLTGNLEIAAYNAPGRIMVAGPKEEIDILCKKLANANIYNIKLPLDRAGHCKMVEKILPELEQFLETVEFYDCEIDFYSSSLGKKVDAKTLCTKEYWINQTLDSVKFQQVVEATKDIDDLMAIEIGTGEQLCSFFNKSKKNKTHVAIPVITEKVEDWGNALKFGLGLMWTVGYPVSSGYLGFDGGKMIGLPGSAFQMKSFTKDMEPGRNSTAVYKGEIVNGFLSHKLEMCRMLAEKIPIQILTIEKENPEIKENLEKWKEMEIEIVEKSGIKCMAQMPELYNVYDEICARVAISYFECYGLFGEDQKKYTFDDILLKTGCIPDYRTLILRLLGFMEKCGYIKGDRGRWYSLIDIKTVSSLQDYIEKAKKSFKDFQYFFDLIEKCSCNYQNVLSGKVPGKEVLYPNGSYEYVRNVFDNTPTYGKSKLYAEIFSEMILDLVRDRSSRFRILELGAGSGIVTWPVMEKLKEYDVEYYFTDIGHSFIYDARNKAKELGVENKMRFFRLDANKSLANQNIPEDFFDVVVSCGMIQSVPDMELVVDNMRRGLRADGILCLLQPVDVHGIRELFGGLTPEWWNYAKDPLRQANYNISVKDWERIFIKHGFDTFIAFDGDEKNITDSAIIMGQLSYEEYEKNREHLMTEFEGKITERVISGPMEPVESHLSRSKEIRKYESDVQQKLLELLREITSEEEVDLNHSMFELDIDSLTGLMLVSKINDIYQIKLTPKELIVCENFMEVAGKIEKHISER